MCRMSGHPVCGCPPYLLGMMHTTGLTLDPYMDSSNPVCIPCLVDLFCQHLPHLLGIHALLCAMGALFSSPPATPVLHCPA